MAKYNLVLVEDKGTSIIVANKHLFTGEEVIKEINCTKNDFDKYLNDPDILIQVVLPNLDKWEREFLINGLSEKDWEEMENADDDDSWLNNL